MANSVEDPDSGERAGRPDPRFILTDLAVEYVVPAALRAAVTLGVADALAAGPRSIEDLARAVGAHPLSLYRTLRLLAARGVFAEDAAGRFALTPAAEPLRSDVPSSFRAAILMLTSPFFWVPVGELEQVVRTGVPIFEALFGTSFFDHFAEDPDTAATFHEGMASMSDPENPIIARAYEFPSAGTIVDLGGGHGGLLLAVLRGNPGLRGVLFDQPHVLAGHRLAELGDGDRWEVVGGDFFAEAPEADLYLIKRILHDWDDEGCVRILRRCREVMSRRSRVLVVDAVVPSGNAPDHAKVIDVLLMSSLTGRERTQAEFEDLFGRAGLRVTRVTPTGTRLAIVEGVPAGRDR